MKKRIVLGLALLLVLWSFAVNAQSEEGIHAFWDIPFGITGDELVTQVKEKHGIDLAPLYTHDNEILFYQPIGPININDIPAEYMLFQSKYGPGDASDFCFTSVRVGFKLLVSQKTYEELPTQEALVAWLDDEALPNFIEYYDALYSMFSLEYGKPDGMFAIQFNPAVIVKIDTLKDAMNASYVMGDDEEPQYLIINAVWGNIQLNGYFLFIDYNEEFYRFKEEKSATFVTSFTFTDSLVELPSDFLTIDTDE